jgi:hypothetical protein
MMKIVFFVYADVDVIVVALVECPYLSIFRGVVCFSFLRFARRWCEFCIDRAKWSWYTCTRIVYARQSSLIKILSILASLSIANSNIAIRRLNIDDALRLFSACCVCLW